METVLLHPVVFISGETGSGKTSQVGQMVYEAGFGRHDASASVVGHSGMIGITQPRRVATFSLSSRVAHELGTEGRRVVAHQIRYESNVHKKTRIKFMTDGVLMRELTSDWLMRAYSVIILDEVRQDFVKCG
jgi:ATP-dependent RNA helicase DHX37/DHR1